MSSVSDDRSENAKHIIYDPGRGWKRMRAKQWYGCM
jgi:hypothetical protein